MSTTYLDVRAMLAAGQDPLELVVSTASALETGAELLLDAPVHPLPLRRILAKMGFSSGIERLADGCWRATFVRDGKGKLSGSEDGCAGLPPAAPTWREGGMAHLDVRGLAMPLPMVAILRMAAGLQPGEEAIIHHERDPIFLHPELAEIGWRLEPLPTDQNGELLFRLIWGA